MTAIDRSENYYLSPKNNHIKSESRANIENSKQKLLKKKGKDTKKPNLVQRTKKRDVR